VEKEYCICENRCVFIERFDAVYGRVLTQKDTDVLPCMYCGKPKLNKEG